MKNIINDQKGVINVIFALTLIVLIGFAALGTEVGKWYLTRAELSKAVDAAALAGAANISNPNIDVVTLARDFGMENFQAGYLGTETGDRSVAFTATQEGGKLTVTGTTSSLAILARIFGVDQVATAATGQAQKNNVEIMMVLDRSGSMSGTPIADLKKAAKGFLDYYQDTQEEDRIGLVSFATGVTVDPPLGYRLNHNFFTPIQTAINILSAGGATNVEDALSQAGAEFEDQTSFPPANRVQQYIVFFTDGRPTAFRTTFVRDNNTPLDAVVCVTGNCDGRSKSSMYWKMGYPSYDPNRTPKTWETWYDSILSNDPPYPTGDGKPTNTTVCESNNIGYINIKWGSFAAYPVSGLGAEAYNAYCGMGVAAGNGPPKIVVTDPDRLNGQKGYICQTARQMAIDHANALKARYVKIYAIGLGDDKDIDFGFLSDVASGPEYVEITPNSDELQAIFNKIAKTIKLRLVQ